MVWHGRGIFQMNRECFKADKNLVISALYKRNQWRSGPRAMWQKILVLIKKKISFLPKRAAFAMQRIEGRKEGKG